VTEPPDFRSDKSESIEGKGVARARWEGFVDQLTPSVIEAVFEERYQAFGPSWAKETSELVGFWIAWHLAGGFEALERAGWNRATIFRKSRRFRTVFGAHPDEFQFDWINLDLKRAWNSSISAYLLDDPDSEEFVDWTATANPSTATSPR
jgi:hypothetical protein